MHMHMQYNSAPHSTLNVKVSIASRPYSNSARAVRICTSFFDSAVSINVNNALHTIELPLAVTAAQLQQQVAKLVSSSNERDAYVECSVAVTKLLARNN